VGSIIRANKVTDNATQKHWYPVDVLKIPAAKRKFSGDRVITVDKVEAEYAVKAAFDMEASGYFATATRFASAELIQCIKVVSDGPEHGVEHITEKIVSRNIASAMEVIDAMIAALLNVQRHLPQAVQSELREWTRRWHFSVSQQHRLTELLRRYRLRYPDDAIGLLDAMAGKFAKSSPGGRIIDALDTHLKSPTVLMPPNGDQTRASQMLDDRSKH
jgi:hypothetical protein